MQSLNISYYYPFEQDVDAYIHRAGRTGRAERRGVCIIFYKYNQENLLLMVERKAVSFDR